MYICQSPPLACHQTVMCETSTHLWLTFAAVPGRPSALHNNPARILQPQLTCTICSPQNMTPHRPQKARTRPDTLHHQTAVISAFTPFQISLLGILAHFKFGLHLTEETPILLSFLLSLSAVYLPTVGVLSYCRT